MQIVFADTFYWVAVTNLSDSNHARATELGLSLVDATMVTTEAVLVEYLNYFANWRLQMRRKAVSNVDDILFSGFVRVLPHGADSFSMGLALYRAWPDKGYS